jgi:hypothetical protein
MPWQESRAFVKVDAAERLRCLGTKLFQFRRLERAEEEFEIGQ